MEDYKDITHEIAGNLEEDERTYLFHYIVLERTKDGDHEVFYHDAANIELVLSIIQEDVRLYDSVDHKIYVAQMELPVQLVSVDG